MSITVINTSEQPEFANSPKKQGFSFPAEWAKHEATWLSWPHKEASWPGKIETIYKPYCEFIKIVATGEKVRINVKDEAMKAFAVSELEKVDADLSQIEFYFNETNDAWCRDHGPAFVVKGNEKAVVDWGYNAWGGKYPPYDLDDVIPTKIAKHFNLPLFTPDIVMEGGSVEFNGAGTILTSTACLLNENRNPHLNKDQIETYLKEFYGAEQILWVGDGIVGDDTDGHIDDITRFVNEDTVLTVLESNPLDENHLLLQENYEALKKMTLLDGRPLNIVKLPMPSPVIFEDTRLPASYANFYIANAAVIVPIFNDVNDQKALDIIQGCFPDRPVVGINSVDIIWGFGQFSLFKSAGTSNLKTMLTLDRIIIFGKDIEALKNFYQSTLKLELIEEIEKEWLVFKTGQTEIAFHRIGLAYRNDEPFEAGGNTKIVFNVHQDLSDLRKVLIAKGVKMREIKSFEGIDFIFCDGEDIEGNVFQLYQKKL